MKKVFIALAFVFAANSYVFSEKITWRMVESQTLQNNPSIAAAKYNLDIAKQALYSSFSSFLPNINFVGSLNEHNGGYRERNILYDKDNGYQQYGYGLSAKISLFSGFSDYNKTRSLSAKVKAAQEEYTRAVSNAVCQAYNSYVNLMYTYELIELYKQILKRKTESRDLVKLRYHSGGVDLGSLRRNEADVKITEYTLETVQRDVENVSASLLAAIGRNDDVTILETDERIVVDKEIISKPDFDNLIIKIPDFLIAKYNLDSVKALNWTHKGEWLPSIELSGDINRQRYDKAWDPESQDWRAVLSLTYPLFSGGKRFFDMKNYAAQEKKTAEDFRNIRNSLKSEAVQLYNKWVDSYKILDVRKFYLESCKLQADIARRRYINGLISYEDWYTIEENYTVMQTKMLSEKQREIMSKIAWIKFLGKVSLKVKEGK